MGIKSLLSKEDFAINVVEAREGDHAAFHKLIQSFNYLVDGFSKRYHCGIGDDLHSAIVVGLVEGASKAIDGRIPLSQLYDRMGPYIVVVIKCAVRNYWELSRLIKSPRLLQPRVVSLDASIADGMTLHNVCACAEDDDPLLSEQEILELLQPSTRDKKILALLLAGHNQSAIANELGVSKSNISMSIKNIRKRAIERGLGYASHGRR